MAKVFIGIALALMLATAALSFLAKGNIDKLQSSLKETKSSRDSAETKARQSSADAKKNSEEREAANAKADEASKQLAAKTTEAEDLSRQVSDAKKMTEEKATEIAALNERIIKMGSPQPGVVAEDPRLAELTTQLQKAQADAAEAKLAADGMVSRMKDTEAKLSAAELKERQRQQVSGRAGLQARILAVNAGWNFVVLSVGDKQGVAINAPLLVVRGGQPIARLRITSVEPSTSIADVLPGTVSRGVTVQPGDTVIFEGRTLATEPKPSGGPGIASEPKLPLP